jgi:hypothetical protein
VFSSIELVRILTRKPKEKKRQLGKSKSSEREILKWIPEK